MRPLARREGLLIRELPDELLVYDRLEHRAHCLNRTAATVFRQADGTREVDDIARLVAPDADPASGEAAVQMALARLAEAGLLEGAVVAAPGEGMTRRDLARRAGLAAAILLPAVASIVAPTPAEAAVSACIDGSGTACSTNVGLPCSCTGNCSEPSYICDGTGTCTNPDCP